jgi:uncharacterized membrane protein YedE/YeeE
MKIIEFLRQPWPWWVAGPLIGLMVPLLLLFDNKQFGISSTMRDFCAYVLPKRVKYFQYNLKEHRWRNIYVLGVLIGGFISASLLSSKSALDISPETVEDLSKLGLTDFSGLVPLEIFSWVHLFTFRGLVFVVLGGFLIGFGTRYADGCTAGHAITGLALLSPASLIAVIGFFTGGLISTHLLFPLIF